MLGTILLKPHVLQRLPDLHWRQAYLAAEAGDDVGGGEIDGLLAFARLAVAGVELRYLFGVELVAESGVEKMTDLRIHADIVDVGLPRVVDMIDFKDERRHRPWSYAASWSSRRNTVAVRAAQQVVHKRRLIRALRTKKYENLMVHHIVVDSGSHHSHQPNQLSVISNHPSISPQDFSFLTKVRISMYLCR